MRTRHAQVVLHTNARHLDTPTPALPNALLARAVTVLRVEIDPSSGANDVDNAKFCTFAARFPNLRFLDLRRWNMDTVLENFLPRVALSNLTILCIGCAYDTVLTVGAFFEMLHMMPALKKLAFGMVDMPEGLDDDDIARDLYVQSLLAPACSLTHLVVNDDIGIDFRHYPLLLSRSHDTLEHLGLHWIFDPDVAANVREALLQCTRVRHLSLEGNSFDNRSIISTCPRLQSLMLAAAPTESEIAALQAPLCSLELANCFSDSPAQFVARVSERLCHIISDTPSLGTIYFNFINRQLQQETQEYRKLRSLCQERRIYLSTVPPARVIYF